MRNAVAAMLAVAMLITSALIALDLAALMRTPLHVVASDADAISETDHEPLVRTFYDAANALLDGERSPLLATVVSPEVETHAGVSPAASGEFGVREYLEGLRLRGARSLRAMRVIGQGPEIAVVVEAQKPPPVDTGETGGPAPLLWRTVDLFHIDAGMIVGYWPGATANPASSPLPSVTMPTSDAKMGVSVSRLELGPGAEPTSLFAPIPHLLLVETRTLTVSRDHAVKLARAGVSQFTSLAVDPGAEDLLVRPGDALLLAEVSPYRVQNPGTSSASALSLLVAPTALLFQQISQISAASSASVTVTAMHDGWRVGRRTAWDNGAITETLAVKHLPIDRGLADVTLSSSQLSLEAGQRNPPLTPGALRFAIVRSGVVGVSVINSDAVAIAAPRPDSQLAVAANHLFWAGDAFWIEASEAPVLANAGVNPLDILLIEVIPVEDGSEATPPGYATEPLETRRRSMPPVPGQVQASSLSRPPACHAERREPSWPQ